ncbi:regulatory protein GemA [Oleidesulfovibrio sp.]|uniref:regulatory protein GemA n=1 Tax=Oleidesulfovibrio sp. TaxID=2909707 RepID=UPI003A859256
MSKADFAKIHIGKKQLGLDKDDVAYRAMLKNMFGVSSSADLDDRQRYRLICHLKELGANFSSKGKTYPKQPRRNSGDFYVIPDNVPYASQKRYILVLWKALGWSLKGIDTRMRKQFGLDSLVWVQDQAQLQTITKDLQNRCRKAGIDPDNA